MDFLDLVKFCEKDRNDLRKHNTALRVGTR